MKTFAIATLATILIAASGCKKQEDGSVEAMSPEEIGQTAGQVAEKTQDTAHKAAAETKEAVGALTVKAEDVMAELGQSVEAVKEKVADFDKAQLQAYVDRYQALILEKKDQLAEATQQLKETPMAEMMSEKTKALKEQMAQYGDEIAALKERCAVYIDQLTASSEDEGQ